MNKKRIETISRMVDKDSIVLDIGTDHALVPIFLIENNIASKVLSTEINKGPFDNAVSNIKKRKLEKEIEVTLGNGLIPYINKQKVDFLSVTGMGTNLIIEILEQSPIPFWDKVILESTNDSPKLRMWLKDNNYKILDEKILKESSKYNSVIKAEINKKTNIKTNFDMEVGPLYKHKNSEYFLIKELLEAKIKHFENVYKNSSEKRHLKYSKKLKKYLEIVILTNNISPSGTKTQSKVQFRWKK